MCSHPGYKVIHLTLHIMSSPIILQFGGGNKYAKQFGIDITTTSPTYSQANGLAEKAVHIVKNLLRKECDLNEGLMEYRNTPINNFPYSPNQMLFSRQIRTRVPVHPLVLVPQICHDYSRITRKTTCQIQRIL